jgi:hypothetical protein
MVIALARSGADRRLDMVSAFIHLLLRRDDMTNVSRGVGAGKPREAIRHHFCGQMKGRPREADLAIAWRFGGPKPCRLSGR